MKKILAIVLCLVLALSCIGTAEYSAVQPNYKVSAELNAMGQQLLSALLGFGTDENGNYAADINVNGVIDAFARIAPDFTAVTAGYNGMAFKVTMAALIEAAQKLGEAYINSNEATKQAFETGKVIGEYIATGAYEADLEIAEVVADGEINRIMQCAMMNGIVAIDEAGNMTINANAQNITAAVGMYLTALSNDSAVFTALASAKIWGILNLPDAITCQALVKEAAAKFMAIDTADVNLSLYLYIGADGRIEGTLLADGLTVTASYEDPILVITETTDDASFCLTYDGTTATAVLKQDGMTTTEVVTETEDGFTLNEIVLRDADMAVLSTTTFALTATGMILTSNSDAAYLGEAFSLDLTVDFTTYSFTADITEGEDTYNLTGAPSVTETGIAYVIALTANGETKILSAGYQMNEDGSFTVYATEGETTYYVTVSYGYTEDGAAQLIIDVNNMYLITAGYGFTEDGGLQGYIDVNGFTITAGYAMQADGSIMLYADVAGQTYYVLITMGYAEDGSITVTAKAYMAGAEADTELGSLIVNILPTLEPLAAKEGVELTADNIVELVNGIIESLTYSGYDYGDYGYDYDYSYAYGA